MFLKNCRKIFETCALSSSFVLRNVSAESGQRCSCLSDRHVSIQLACLGDILVTQFNEVNTKADKIQNRETIRCQGEPEIVDEDSRNRGTNKESQVDR